MTKQKYYVVWKGKKPGIYDSWSACQEQINGYNGAMYKSFKTQELAKRAYANDPKNYIGSKNKSEKDTLQIIADHPDIIENSFCVDAACSGNPGQMEYRGVHTIGSGELFRIGPLADGTNNVGEFLALVHMLALSQQKDWESLPIYSDSKIAISWVAQKKCKTKLKRSLKNSVIFDLITRAEKWLHANEINQKIIKWETKSWGEIPADFGRK